MFALYFLKLSVTLINKINPQKTIHFFTKGDRNSASSRQRAYNVADRLLLLGLPCIVHEPFVSFLNKTKWQGKLKVMLQLYKCLLQVKKQDVIFLQRTVYSNYFILVVFMHRFFYRRKIIFDFDDAVFYHFPTQTKWLSRKANEVIVGSHKLQEWALQHNKNVRLIPTAIDFSSYSKYSIQYIQHDFITIGWIGHGPDNYENLEILIPVLQQCADRKMNIQVLIIGSLGSQKVKSLFAAVQGITINFIDALDWSEKDVIPCAIKAFDIGVMPLKNTNWNESKCSFKAIECMALGMPVVISAIGENNYLLKDGENGFTANNTNEWCNKLEQLVCNAALRKKLGLNGQQTIQNNYSYHTIVPKMYDLLQAL